MSYQQKRTIIKLSAIHIQYSYFAPPPSHQKNAKFPIAHLFFLDITLYFVGDPLPLPPRRKLWSGLIKFLSYRANQ